MRVFYLTVVLLMIPVAMSSSMAPVHLWARLFRQLSYTQLAMVTLMMPILVSPVLKEDANRIVRDALLVTPLSSLHITLGRLLGRAFPVFALLSAGLPLFVLMNGFGGVEWADILASYAIAAATVLLIGSAAVAMGVLHRTSPLMFTLMTWSYFATTFLARQLLEGRLLVAANPFLALSALLNAEDAHHHNSPSGWMEQPVATYCVLCVCIGVALTSIAIILLRREPRYKTGQTATKRRTPRAVGRNPIVWRERYRDSSRTVYVARWCYEGASLVGGFALVLVWAVSEFDADSIRAVLAVIVSLQAFLAIGVALHRSAAAVAGERESDTLDVLMTTPIAQKPVLLHMVWGIYLRTLPLTVAPIVTLAPVCVYTTFRIDRSLQTHANLAANHLSIVIPEGAVDLALLLLPLAFLSVVVGLRHSLTSFRRVRAFLVAAVVVLGPISCCASFALPVGQTWQIGPLLVGISPLSLMFAIIMPDVVIPAGVAAGMTTARWQLFAGAGAGGLACVLVGALLLRVDNINFRLKVRRYTGVRVQ